MAKVRIHNNEGGYEVFRGKTYIGRRKTLRAAENLCFLVEKNEDNFDSWYCKYRKENIKTEYKNRTHKRISTGISAVHYTKNSDIKYRVKIKYYGISYELGYYKDLSSAKFIRAEAERFRSLGLFLQFYNLNKGLFSSKDKEENLSLLIEPLC